MKQIIDIKHTRKHDIFRACKRLPLALFCVLMFSTPEIIQAQDQVAPNPNNVLEHIADPCFRNYIQSRMTGTNKWDINCDGILSPEEAAKVTVIDVSGMKIQTLSGIEHFPELVTLVCRHNHLTTINISTLRKLEVLNCNYNPLETLYVWWSDGIGGKPKSQFMQFLIPATLQIVKAEDK